LIQRPAPRDNSRIRETTSRLTWDRSQGGTSVNIVADCTVPEKILLAASQLEDQGQSPFSAEALVVAAWQKFPRTFGLKGYSDQYPDSNKVLTSIMGEKGLARRGWLAKMGQKLYSLTREGRNTVRSLLEGEESDAPTPAPTRLTKEQEKFLLNLFSTTAVEKYQQGLKQELTFADACRFWNVTENLRGQAVDARLDRLRDGLTEAETLIGDEGVDLSNGRNVSSSDLRLLRKVDEHLMERFSRHLTLVRNRSDRR
jgi:hypothetical protein